MNIKEELCKWLIGKSSVKGIVVRYSPATTGIIDDICLEEGYSNEDYENFLSRLDFNFEPFDFVTQLIIIALFDNGWKLTLNR